LLGHALKTTITEADLTELQAYFEAELQKV
jgi:hypothetical protein